MPAPRPYRPGDRAAFHSLLNDSVLASQFAWLIENRELEDPLHHPFAGPSLAWVAEGDGELAGFSTVFWLDSQRGPWGLLRAGVRERYRRRGLGRALVEHARAGLAQRIGAGAEARISYWEPCEGGEGFARAVGFEHDRYPEDG